MSKRKQVGSGSEGSTDRSTRFYILLAVVLVIVIAVIAYLLVTLGIPALRGDEQPTAEPAATATPVPTFTPAATKEPTNTPLPSPTPTPAAPVMAEPESPIYVFESAGARPSVEWTGFFGQVTDASAAPVEGVLVAVWYRDGQLAAPLSETDETGYYEVRLADAPLAGIWTIQLLTEDLKPASVLLTFETNEDTEQGIQQIQVLWTEAP